MRFFIFILQITDILPGTQNAFIIVYFELPVFISIRDSIDYKNPTPEQMRDRILKKVRNGSIMLFHSGAMNTPAALPLVIEEVNEKGFTFVRVSDLIHKKPYTVDYEGRQKKA